MTTTFQMLLESSLRICVVAVAVWISLIICRIRPGVVSHKAWTAVLLTMLVIPVVPGLIPPIRLPVPEAALSSDVFHFDLKDLPASISATTLQRTSTVVAETATTAHPVDASH